MRQPQVTREVSDSAMMQIRPGYLILWYIVSAIFLLFLPSVQSQQPFWEFSEIKAVPLESIMVGFLTSALLLTLYASRVRPKIIPSLAIVAIVFFGVLIFLQYQRLYISPIMLKVHLPAAAILLVVPLVLPWARWTSLLLLSGIAVFVGLFGSGNLGTVTTGGVPSEIRTVVTANNTLRVAYFNQLVPTPATTGGGIARYGDDFLLATADGDLFIVDPTTDLERVAVTQLLSHIPQNANVFDQHSGLRRSGAHFRTFDLIVEESNSGLSLYVSHPYWLVEEDCAVVRVSEAKTSNGILTADTEPLTWRTVYQSSPCLTVDKNDPGFGGHQGGGRLARLDDERLLLTTGDFETVGMYTSEKIAQSGPVSQDSTSHYGKIIEINIKSGESRIYTSGHRNPQGLTITDNGVIYATEHGPKGGDELNIIDQGGNYGWPWATYGTDYGKSTWHLATVQSSHEGYDSPVFSWLPSIGVSNLISVREDHFLLWKNDLVVASLKENSLFRVRVTEGRTMFVEPIYIGRRIRDLEEGKDGTLALWTDKADLVLISRDERVAGGEGLFLQNCSSCHFTAGEWNKSVGPDLFNIYESKTASADGFDYSNSLRDLGGEWTETRLDSFLENPSRMAPGTTMMFPGIIDPEERKLVVEYLKTLHH